MWISLQNWVFELKRVAYSVNFVALSIFLWQPNGLILMKENIEVLNPGPLSRRAMRSLYLYTTFRYNQLEYSTSSSRFEYKDLTIQKSMCNNTPDTDAYINNDCMDR